MNRRFLLFSLFVSILSFSTSICASLRIPKGFEELAEGQTILSDVSIYGESLGIFKISVDLENIHFIEPNKIINAILKQYPDSHNLKGMLSKYFDGTFHRNSQLSCSSNGDQPGCDFIDTNNVDIIYDEDNARVNVFISDKYITSQKKDKTYYAVNAESHNAFIHQQNINFVADKNYQSASIQGNGTLGIIEDGYLNVDWNFQGQRSKSKRKNDIFVNNAYVRRDLFKRFYLQAGIMDSKDIFSNIGGNINLSQLPLGKIRGFRAGSTLAWVNVNKVNTGTPINIFLSHEARVDAYRGEQLLSSFYLKAGAQALDTRSLPQGSYTISLKVYENNQLVRTETVPYTGLGELTSRTLQWFIQGGVPDNEGYVGSKNDKHQDDKVFQAGIRLPVMNNVALTSGVAYFNSANFWESAIDWSHGFDMGWVDGVMTSRVSYLHGSEGSRGTIQQLNYNDGFSLSFYRSEMKATDCDNQGVNRYSINGCYKSTNIMLSVPLDNWYATLGFSTSMNKGRYITRQDMVDYDPNYSFGVPWETVYQSYSKSSTWQAGLTRTANISGLNITTSLNAFLRNDSSYNAQDKGMFVTLSLSTNTHDIEGNRGTFSASSNVQTSKRAGNAISYNIASSQYSDDTGENEKGISINGINTDTITSSLYGRAGGQYGAGAVTISDTLNKTGGGNIINGSGNYSSSFILDREGLTVGRWGDGTASSAITINVNQGDTSDSSKVNVSVDTSGQSEVKGNSRALFTVPGYRESQVNVDESTLASGGVSSEIKSGTGVRKIFMTPGKVYNRDVKIESHYTWMAHLLDETGNAVEEVIPLNVISWAPLGNGLVTFETTQKMKMLYVMKNNAYLQCGMKVSKMRDVIRYVGETTCKSINFASLPSAEKKQATIMTAKAKSNTSLTVMNN
ncbi:TcfC E-set like domain-containing protein [Rosenbergiella epipactidis]|uniref:TcfC E-set like domain-containing protein n=1 Tax=Rosenbergiella epipactidis TaxID=1544694 RepID=UPI001F4D363A|nr:TcfC E-set like domain-containing protein [Rosenbergiella epipactidis]